jgi:hypothetical protein
VPRRLQEPRWGVDALQAARRLFTRRLGFAEASPQQRAAWRRELPEYHRALMAGCQVLASSVQPATCWQRRQR